MNPSMIPHRGGFVDIFERSAPRRGSPRVTAAGSAGEDFHRWPRGRPGSARAGSPSRPAGTHGRSGGIVNASGRSFLTRSRIETKYVEPARAPGDRIGSGRRSRGSASRRLPVPRTHRRTTRAIYWIRSGIRRIIPRGDATPWLPCCSDDSVDRLASRAER